MAIYPWDKLYATILKNGQSNESKKIKLSDMKNLLLLFAASLFLFFSCEKDDVFPIVENTTKGEKWSIQIGSPPTEVYARLQELGAEKNFGSVSIVYRKPYSNPEEIQDIFGFYHALTLETKSGVTERAVIFFEQDSVSSIEIGGALLDTTSAWPPNTPNEITIHIDDQTSTVYQKLLSICQVAPYNGYQIILPDKSLDRPFDPDMANYDEWGFCFQESISSNKIGRSSVRLFFKNEKLARICHRYEENETVN